MESVNGITAESLYVRMKSLTAKNSGNVIWLTNNHKFAIKCDGDSKENKLLSSLVGYTFNRKNQFATISLSLTNGLKLLEFAENNGYCFGQNAGKKLLELKTLNIPGITCSIFPHQKEAINFICEKKKVLIADEMGLGKSFEALAALHLLEVEKVLIICPVIMKKHWAEEITNKLGDDSITILNGGKATPFENRRFTIVNYDVFLKWTGQFKNIRFDAVIFDESHRLKNIGYKDFKPYLDFVKNIDYTILLSGTPIENRPSELINQLKLLGYLNTYKEVWDFQMRFCAAQKMTNKYNGKTYLDCRGASNMAELNTKLQGFNFLRRLKVDVFPNFPCKHQEKVLIDMDNADVYTRAESNFSQFQKENLKFDESSSKGCPNLIKDNTIVRNKGVCKENKVFSNTKELQKISALRVLVSEGKTKFIIDWVIEFKTSGEKIILFYWHNSMGEELSKALNAPLINGQVKTETKHEIIENFKRDSSSQVLVINIDSGCEGIDLSVCHNVAFCELVYSPASHLQAEDRCHRLNQTKPVTAYYFVAKDTFDEKMFNFLERKLRVIKIILGEEKYETTDKGDFIDELKLN